MSSLQNLKFNLKELCPTYIQDQQFDVHEFMLSALVFAERAGSRCTLKSLAGVEFVTDVQCCQCKNHSIKSEVENDIKVPLTKGSVHMCVVETLFEREMLGGDNKYFCDSCNSLNDAIKTSTVTRTSQLLILQLKRFSFTVTGSSVKINTGVTINTSFTISTDTSTKHYSLRCFVSHMGPSMNSGHYIAYVRQGCNWYELNDNKVNTVSEMYVLTKQPYVMIYEEDGGLSNDPGLTVTEDSNSSLQQMVMHKLVEIVESNRRGFYGDEKTQKLVDKLACMTDIQPQFHLATPALCVSQKDNTQKQSNNLPSVQDYVDCLSDLKGKDEIVTNIVFSGTMYSSKKTFPVSRQQLRCLKQPWMCSNTGFLWLSDVVVNAYAVLIAQSTLKEKHRAYPISSLMLEKISVCGASNVATTWLKKDKLFAYDSWIVPVHLGIHWAMMVVQLTDKVIYYSDSLGCSSGTTPILKIISFIKERYLHETGRPMNWKEWKVNLCTTFPKQTNGYDCGVFALKAAECLICHHQPNYSESDMPRIRLEVLYELIHTCLLPSTNDRNNPLLNGAISASLPTIDPHKGTSQFSDDNCSDVINISDDHSDLHGDTKEDILMSVTKIDPHKHEADEQRFSDVINGSDDAVDSNDENCKHFCTNLTKRDTHEGTLQLYSEHHIKNDLQHNLDMHETSEGPDKENKHPVLSPSKKRKRLGLKQGRDSEVNRSFEVIELFNSKTKTSTASASSTAIDRKISNTIKQGNGRKVSEEPNNENKHPVLSPSKKRKRLGLKQGREVSGSFRVTELSNSKKKTSTTSASFTAVDRKITNTIKQENGTKVYFCTECSKTFQHYASLYKHRKSIHKLQATGHIECKEKACMFKCHYINQLRVHLSSHHGVKMDMEEITLPTLEDFKSWKDAVEKETCSWFIKECGQKKIQGNKVCYYYCNRSGHFAGSKGSGLRSMKSQGTSKINAHCTAGLQQQFNHNKTIKVSICKTHYGHTPNLGHLRLQYNDRVAIAGMLAQGISIDRILDKVRDSVGQQLDRLHLLTKKDIHNIENSFGLHREQRHSDDATSVHEWVQAMKKRGESSPVLFYKKQGTVIPDIGTNNGLQINDFALVIQTPLQADVLKKCGERKVVCVDATHGTNAYDFQLISVLVVDEFGEGFPAGWCFSNREDGTLLRNFFMHLKQHTGEIHAQWFMSDMAEQYYTSWNAIFGGTPRKLICTWHVDKAWQSNISIIKDRNVQVSTYCTLRVLLEETNKDKFEKMLKNTLEQWKTDSSVAEFQSYFAHNYAKKPEQWASCYRVQAGINTNMYVESFHKVLKYMYLKGKTNKRLDKCIHVLMQYSRDKAFDRILKREKGKQTKRNIEIAKRHRKSLLLSFTQIEVSNSTQWMVTSNTKTATYTVVKSDESCDGCWLRCQSCSICIHSFTCTCYDSLLHGTICKHVHLVVRFIDCTRSKQSICKTKIPIQTTEDVLINSVQNPNLQLGTISIVRERILSKLSQIAAEVHATDNEDSLLEIETMINSTISSISATIKGISLEPSNKHITKQRPFQSTKRKRKNNRIRLCKPSFEEKLQIAERLATCKVNITQSCLSIIMMLAKPESVTQLLHKGMPIEPDGVLQQTDVTSMLILDITPQDLQSLKPHFTPQALKDILITVHQKQLIWRCNACNSTNSKQNMIACDQCDLWFHWDCVQVTQAPDEEDAWFCQLCTKKTVT